MNAWIKTFINEERGFTKKRIVNLILVALILIVFAVPVSAKPSDGSSQTVFVSDIHLSSVESRENLSVLSEDLEQIVLCTKKGGEVWTIGILKDGNTVLDNGRSLRVCGVL